MEVNGSRGRQYHTWRLNVRQWDKWGRVLWEVRRKGHALLLLSAVILFYFYNCFHSTMEIQVGKDDHSVGNDGKGFCSKDTQMLICTSVHTSGTSRKLRLGKMIAMLPPISSRDCFDQLNSYRASLLGMRSPTPCLYFCSFLIFQLSQYSCLILSLSAEPSHMTPMPKKGPSALEV